ncbi:MAG: alkaline phosphatase family protein [Flavobacteriales bacterium]|nr:alkaline phosphatase family protein [Flavobacteriia bacterium]NCP06585.1 alkaline phosphatase family protein [Flavobacteriales bacterium]PIV94733.1 MAG: alkaline phosphatase [Flavobacteriaceae bacterium CG17_big_fil_post_rev_8_21_14_2_50_33_15]PIY13496.1 MAG: alkaline phosphatase [Flavobacteriaceae bacterium CG_4_10_14_3_um_filter_33_47]PJB16912.1 MAG: alkaline phosphatase [Flavobacteriaceae bacterium CG_4_9_14_3_um_filter_33_16]
MKIFIQVLWVVSCMFLHNCKSTNKVLDNDFRLNKDTIEYDYTIAFGSCNKQDVPNLLWTSILKHNPNLWIWGGDNIYSDTDNMTKMKLDYNQQLSDKNYKKLIESAKILGTWDDHDYGLNDGGLEFVKKKESQQQFLDFIGVSPTDKRRRQSGVYHSEIIHHKKGTINIIILDTRYFRSSLTDDDETKKRYKPNKYGVGTVLGEQQWVWLEENLKTSKADFNIIVSSIQFLSKEHGFETWGNFPHEVDRLTTLISESKAKGVLLLSGDRHISEFSKMDIKGMDYPLVDFTSSGLTHSYTNYSGELNSYRVGKVISEISFGLLHFNFKKREIIMQMRGMNDVKLQELIQTY